MLQHFELTLIKGVRTDIGPTDPFGASIINVGNAHIIPLTFNARKTGQKFGSKKTRTVPFIPLYTVLVHRPDDHLIQLSCKQQHLVHPVKVYFYIIIHSKQVYTVRYCIEGEADQAPVVQRPDKVIR